LKNKPQKQNLYRVSEREIEILELESLEQENNLQIKSRKEEKELQDKL